MKVDEDLQQEYNAVLSTGLFEVVLFGYDQWFNDGKFIVKNAPNVKLVTEPAEYERIDVAHLKRSFHRFMVKDFIRFLKLFSLFLKFQFKTLKLP